MLHSLFFDFDRKRVYAICGQGVVEVVQQRDVDHYQSVAQVTTTPGARTGLCIEGTESFRELYGKCSQSETDARASS